MRNRFDNALGIQQGACNPSGITHSLLEAIQEMSDAGAGTQEVCDDPAVRLIAHQLAYVLNIGEIDDNHAVYQGLMTDCAMRAGGDG